MNISHKRKLWEKSTTAFVVRMRAQFWGKHNEDAHAWLYTTGFKLKYAREMLFGLNLKNVYRSAEKWGVDAGSNGKIAFPAGVVIPYLEDKKVLKIVCIDINTNNITEIYPDKSNIPDIFFLREGNKNTIIIEDHIKGMLFHQKYHDSCNVIIPSLEKNFSSKDLLDRFNAPGKIFFCPEGIEKSKESDILEKCILLPSDLTIEEIKRELE